MHIFVEYVCQACGHIGHVGEPQPIESPNILCAQLRLRGACTCGVEAPDRDAAHARPVACISPTVSWTTTRPMRSTRKTARSPSFVAN